MKHHTKDKGDIAAIMAMYNLTEKGYTILSPVVSEHLPFDFIAYKDNISLRIQAKYSSDGSIRNKTSWNDKNGNHVKFYNEKDFDYYAIYLPDVKKVIYPYITFGGCAIRTIIPNSPTSFYWYEDFLELTKEAKKRTYKDFGLELTFTRKITNKVREAHLKMRKVERPSKEELQKLLWEKPTLQLAKQFGVSDKAVEKWSKLYGLTKPPRGYWAKISNQ
jgi:hypothetical protein